MFALLEWAPAAPAVFAAGALEVDDNAVSTGRPKNTVGKTAGAAGSRRGAAD